LLAVRFGGYTPPLATGPATGACNLDDPAFSDAEMLGPRAASGVFMITARTALCLALLIGCKGSDKGDSENGIEGTASLSVYPHVGGQGVSMEIDLDATTSIFEFGATSVDFGQGISVVGVDVDDGWGARADIVIEPDAELGLRDVVVTVDGRERTIAESFEVISQSFVIDPDSAAMGETLDIALAGQNTLWTGGVTWPSFGDEITVQDFTVLSETLATATVTVGTEANPGWRDVVMDNGGGDLVTLYDGFKIDRVALAAEFDPVEAEQGDTVEFIIRARGTDFVNGDPTLTFIDRYGENPDIVVDSVTVLDAENMYGQMTLSNAATLGMRDVKIETREDGVQIPDAFEVVAGDWSLEEVAIDLSYTVVRVKDETTGEISERIAAACTFFIPLDPPCPTGGGSGSGSGELGDPSPYDVNGVWGVTGEGSGSADDCPYPTTIGAGEYVWLESDANIVTLDRVEDTSTGLIYYYTDDLTMEDYVTNNWYDLHTQGQDDGIGEYVLEGVQPTVPSDWEWLTPETSGGYVHNRAEDFDFTWTPAMTYPDAFFIVTLYSKSSPGPLEEENWVGYAGVIPWDDGEHSFSASDMSTFAAGTAPLYAYSFIRGPEFGLPESIYQENTAVSYIFLVQSLTME